MYREMGVRQPQVPTQVPETLTGLVAADASKKDQALQVMREGSRQFALLTIVDIVVFFAVLLVGFAYVWYRGDLDWVRAVSRERAAVVEVNPPPNTGNTESVLSA